jgi:hypothetical protein
MALYRQRWLSKPPRGTLIDRTHPWVRGMQGFYALNEATGSVLNDSTGNLSLALSGFGPTNPWASSLIGMGMAGTVSQAGAFASLPPRLRFGWPLTVMTGFQVLGSCVGATSLMEIFQNNSGASAVFGTWINVGPTTLGMEGEAAGTYFSGAISSAAPVIGTRHVVSSTIAAGGLSAYLDGVRVSHDTTTRANPTYSSTAALGLGLAYGFAGTRISNLLFSWSAWWNVALPDSVHTAIGSNVNAIWQIMRPMSGVSTFAGSAASPLFRRSFYGRSGSRGVA